MKKFLAVFVAPVESYDKMKGEMKDSNPEQQKGDMEAWMQWMGRHKGSLVDPGAPVGKTKRITKGGVANIRNEIGGYMIIQAEDLEAAAKIFDDSPHFGVQNGAVDVMEIMEMSRM